ncbi:unnamed protein product, partial [Amoebophrya sp. A25]
TSEVARLAQGCLVFAFYTEPGSVRNCQKRLLDFYSYEDAEYEESVEASPRSRLENND